MDYPKPFMSKNELIKMGLSEKYLYRAIAVPGQRFAFKENPANKNSPIKFDTVEFEKWRIKDAEMQEKARAICTTVA